MRKIIFEEPANEILYNDVDFDKPIFAKKDGMLVGMLVCGQGEGWMIATGRNYGENGGHNTPKKCMITAADRLGYTFHTE